MIITKIKKLNEFVFVCVCMHLFSILNGITLYMYISRQFAANETMVAEIEKVCNLMIVLNCYIQ